MRTTIETIIQNRIPSGVIFDVHTIINYLIQHHNDLYLEGLQNDIPINTYHSNISSAIDRFDGRLITRLTNDSWSRNINMNYNENNCWRKN